MNTYQKNYTRGIFLLYCLFLVSIIFSFRAVSSVSIGLLFLGGVLNRESLRKFVRPGWQSVFLISCTVLFLLQLLSLLYTQNTEEGWKHIRGQLGLIIIPLAVLMTGSDQIYQRSTLLKFFCGALLVAAVYCLFVGTVKFLDGETPGVFFYHELVRPIKQHAVYFSIYVLLALVFLTDRVREKKWIVNSLVHLLVIGFFSIFLFLLSSKLIIAIYLLSLGYQLITWPVYAISVRRRVASASILVFLSTSLVFYSSNPVSRRFNEIIQGDLTLIREEKFTPGHYFNGLQFRLLQWKWVGNILDKNDSWGVGIAPGDAQAHLDELYREKNLYTGTPERGDHGYLGYNTHNQFLQVLLQNGIIGLAVFLVICISMLKMTLAKRNKLAIFSVILLLVYCLSESLLETQYGMILFLFFPLFMQSNFVEKDIET